MDTMFDLQLFAEETEGTETTQQPEETTQPTAEEEKKFTNEDLKARMLEVGCKLCQDLMDGKARDEKTALTAIVEIYGAVK